MRRMTGVAVLALCLGLVAAGCKKKGPPTAGAEMAGQTAVLKKQIKKQIKDKLRRDKLLLIVDDIDRERSKLIADFLALQTELRSNPTMPPEEVDAIVQRFAAMRVGLLRKMAELRLELRQHATEAEWNTLFAKQREERLEAAGAADKKAQAGEEDPS